MTATRNAKFFAAFQIGGCVLILGLLIATIIAHKKWSGDEDYSINTKQQAIYFTSSYVTIGAYGLATLTTILLVYVLSLPVTQTTIRQICFALYSALDAFFVVCAGGVFIGSQVAALYNGGGVAMLSCLFFLLALKFFPMSLIKFNVLATKRNWLPPNILKIIGIVVIVVGAVATVAYAAIILSIYIRVLYHDHSLVTIYLMYLNLLLFLNITLLTSFSCLIAWKEKLTAYTVDVINFLTQLASGYALNFTIIYLYFLNDDDENKTDVFFYNTQIAMIIAVIMMTIISICISVMRPLFPINESKKKKPDESQHCNESSSAEHTEKHDDALLPM